MPPILVLTGAFMVGARTALAENFKSVKECVPGKRVVNNMGDTRWLGLHQDLNHSQQRHLDLEFRLHLAVSTNSRTAFLQSHYADGEGQRRTLDFNH
jgi:hypothetical protein